ncbi:hypothetical protein B0T26DRAFT_640113 [Lasiosphaeria miniovina]|uniref:Cell wall biogenesis protein Mhp1 n=1 Tax=Lasiosphaeria miniovina TaxID=1954250 RepID=A0AA40B3G0_9PEZI|nr:uncharacterized protein B0T26DRAFT_640113 [Lasiosphaeria miniovina]KAK0726970.1 hypothetical protein B0T26DRAFT_640113 [Lasiosphaeria miniovina]
MEHIHGVDVSWMTHGNPKDKTTKVTTRPRSLSQLSRGSLAQSPPLPSPLTPPATPNGPQIVQSAAATIPPSPRQAIAVRPPLSRPNADEKGTLLSSSAPAPSPEPVTSPPIPQRRGSWFSNISSKFSSGTGNSGQSPPQANTASPKPAEFSVPKSNPVKNAVLQHASKHEGEGPYTPAPPRSTQAGIMHVFRRLSSSNGTLSPGVKPHNHGLVERRVLNVDRNRERCDISGLQQAKLRRVAFCVDVEIAPMPKYMDESTERKPAAKAVANPDKDQKRKIKEKGEGEALKNPSVVVAQKEENGEVAATGEELPKEPTVEGTDGPNSIKELDLVPESNETPGSEGLADKTTSAEAKKKEKKKKSEEERKARKERKRKLAEANGTIPMEIYVDSDSSSSGSIPRPSTPKTQAVPTTNPVRIYRRCCQLRETPILKKITEQLLDPANSSVEPGMVEKLDLTGYWMQLGDLVTLGDYLAVVPVREVILENCGLTDEGLRVILAGLLAARKVSAKRRKPPTEPDGLAPQGGVVERLVLKNNKAGPEGWKHICLFLYLCRTLKCLDLSGIPLPRPAAPAPGAASHVNGNAYRTRPDQDVCRLLARSLAERLGGSTLGLLHLGQAGFSAEQLGIVIDGVIKCGVRRLGLAHNDIDDEGIKHVAKFINSGQCEGLDLGGNDMRDRLGIIADALQAKNCPLWALSLADCNLKPWSLCKLMSMLVKLPHFKFIDLSHNHELFNSNPSAVSLLRRYLPKMACLKRIHLADCAMTPEQVISLTEIIPEVPGLAHISFLENPALVQLTTNANTDEIKEEAFALFASFLAAARVSKSLVAVDIEVPSEQSSDLIKAMAKHVVAYCLRNMERLPVGDLAAVASATESQVHEPEYPDVLQRLIGHDVMQPVDLDADVDVAPDEDYVISGTGVVKALACCLKNRGDESRRQSGEFIRDFENGIPEPRPDKLPTGKAKETSKHLLFSARKIRHRLQPAISKAKAAMVDDQHTYHRLMFLDNTLKGIIKRFEDEFPDTRESSDSAVSLSPAEDADYDANAPTPPWSAGLSSSDLQAGAISDNEDDTTTDGLAIRAPLVRSNSAISLTSKALADEEGRVLRAGHQFRVGIVKPEHYALLTGVEMVGADPKHVRMLHELLDDLGDANGSYMAADVKEKGVVRVFQENREDLLQKLRTLDPVYWDRFVESQEMARANVQVSGARSPEVLANMPSDAARGDMAGSEEALVDE